MSLHVAPTWRKVQEISADHHSSMYLTGGVGCESRIINDESSIINANCSSILKKAKLDVPRRELEESSGKFLGLALIHVHRKQHSR
jgi:hypothetical protein